MTRAGAPKQKLRGTSRDDIIEVSRAIIEDEGVEQLTIRRIAETINRTQPAVYQHFPGKDAIVEAIVNAGFSALAERLQRARRGDKASLAEIANAYVRFGLERPRLYDIMFVGAPAITFAAGAATPAPARAAFNVLTTAVEESGVPSAQTETVTEVVWASLHGLVTLTITRRLRPGGALHQARLKQLIATLVEMTARE